MACVLRSRACLAVPPAESPSTMKSSEPSAAVFVQSWFADLAFGRHLRREAPPKNVPVYRVLVTGLWSGPGAPAETREVFYAADRTTVWISFPHRPPITGRPASTTVPPPAKSWYVALPRVREAFAGTASLVPPPGTATTPTTSNASTSGEVAKHSSSSVLPWVLSVVAAHSVSGDVTIAVRRGSKAFLDRAYEVAWQSVIQDAPHLLATAAIALLVKGAVIPAALHRIVRQLGIHREIEEVIGAGPTMLTGLGLVALSILLVMPVGPSVSVLVREDLAFALAIILLGMLMMITRRNAVTQIVGFMSLENGLVLAASGAKGMPLVVEFSTAFSILIAFIVFGIFVFRIRERFDTVDVSALDRFRGEQGERQ